MSKISLGPVLGPTLFDEAYGLADAVLEGLGPEAGLDALAPMLRHWHKRQEMLVDLIVHAGYSIRPWRDFDPATTGEDIVYVYHDVHARDIVGAIAMADVNRRKGITTTFFLNWNFNTLDAFCRQGFALFRSLEGPHVDVGLHVNPVATWMCFVAFGGNEDRYTRWVHDEAEEALRRLSNPSAKLLDRYTVDDIVAGADSELAKNIKDMRKVFPGVSYVSHHGDVLAELMPKWGDIPNRSLFNAFGFLTPERLSKHGLKGITRNVCKEHRIDVYSENKNASLYLENLAERLEKRGTFALLSHPAGLAEIHPRLTFNESFFRAYTGRAAEPVHASL